MKTGLLVICLYSLSAGAQTLELQQLQVNIEKLAQLKTMLSQMKQGCQVLEKGYNSVRDAVRGNFDLHSRYLDELLQVSATVRSSRHKSQVTSNHNTAKSEYQSAMQKFTGSGLFNASELSTIKTEWERLASLMTEDTKVMETVLTDGTMRMNDAERMAILAAVNQSSVVLLAGIRKLLTDYSRTMSVRSQHRRDIDALKRLRGVQ